MMHAVEPCAITTTFFLLQMETMSAEENANAATDNQSALRAAVADNQSAVHSTAIDVESANESAVGLYCIAVAACRH